MPYELKPGEPIPDGVVRVMHEQLERITRHLRGKQSAETRVHETRKRIKETRALLRLVRNALGDAFDVENHWYRDAGHELSVARDATAVIESALTLRKHVDDHELRAAFAHIARVLRRGNDAESHVDERIERLLTKLPEARERLARWPSLPDQFATIGDGLERTFRDGRKALRQLDNDDSAMRVHELRKRVKDHWYHVRLLTPAWPAFMKRYAEVLESISDDLGDHHDLSVLRQTLQNDPARFGEEAKLDLVFDAIDGRLKELEKSARKYSAPLFSERPAAFRRRMRGYWKARGG